ncbi:MAG TPA: nucleoside triphosphate pyrophosphohydrolase family protein [Candidatus Saccharimonadales bacterium]|nr:nucleoside triphosphate pyrophosphohydrolase family protein [Candidatus Saccharimonadales bacterium]
MTADEYQKVALTTAVNEYEPIMEKTIWAMGIAGEAGEVIEKWKKIVAYRDGQLTDDDVQDFKKELGDVLWYVAVFAHTLGISLDDIMRTNAEKLADRNRRGKIKGAGDNR